MTTTTIQASTDSTTQGPWLSQTLEEIVAQLSEPVRAALEPAVQLVESLLADLGDERKTQAQEARTP